jgi:hypothetical protein
MTVRNHSALLVLGGVLLAAPSHATCFDRVRDGAETDVDCGGYCAPCAQDSACRISRDCASGRCAEGVCEEQRYESGTPIPPGYSVEVSDSDAAAKCRTLGWIALGVGYGAAYVAAISLPGEVSWLYVPVIGPWAEVADKNQDLRGVIAIDGLFQTVGAGLLIGGIATAGHRLVRDDAPAARIQVTPTRLGRNGYGLAVFSVF